MTLMAIHLDKLRCKNVFVILITTFVYLWLSDIGYISFQCPYKIGLGIKCPGCGYTTALLSMLHGDMGTALRNNLIFIPLTQAFLGITFLYVIKEDHKLISALSIPVVLLIFTALRNI